jgi:ribokinase
MGAKVIVAKTGKDGAYLSTSDAFVAIPTFKVHAVDTTAAGDSFNAGMAYGLSMGLDLPQSVQLGHAVASISVTKLGAQTAMPDGATLRRFLVEHQSELAQVV